MYSEKVSALYLKYEDPHSQFYNLDPYAQPCPAPPPPSPHPTHTGRTMAWDTAAHTAWTTQPRLHGYFSLHLLDGSTSLPKTVHHGGRPWLMDWTQIVGFCLYTCGVQILGQNISAHSDVLYEVAWSNLCTCGMQL